MKFISIVFKVQYSYSWIGSFSQWPSFTWVLKLFLVDLGSFCPEMLSQVPVYREKNMEREGILNT